jgi:hypothetical protein
MVEKARHSNILYEMEFVTYQTNWTYYAKWMINIHKLTHILQNVTCLSSGTQMYIYFITLTPKFRLN